MERKLLKKIIACFVVAGIVFIGLFSMLLYLHEAKNRVADIDLVLQQFEDARTKAEERMEKKRAIYETNYFSRGRAIDFFLEKDKDMQTVEGLSELRTQLQVENIYLLDEKGKIILGSSEDSVGKELMDTKDGHKVKELLSDLTEESYLMVLNGGQVFSGIAKQDFVVMKSALNDFAALFVDIGDDVVRAVNDTIAPQNVMGNVTVMRGQVFMVVDEQSGKVLGTTYSEAREKQINEETMNVFKHAKNGGISQVYGKRCFVKSKMYDGMLLVCINEYNRCVEAVLIQVVTGSLLLAGMFMLILIIIRRHFRRYVFSEFNMIEETMKAMASGKNDLKFQAAHDTEINRIIEVLNEMTDMHAEMKVAAKDADRDSLTGLINRRGFERFLQEFLADSCDKGTMLMMDIDNFKAINDNLGHPEGDRVLKTVADCLKDTFRHDDLVVRFGGDEFIVFLCSEIPKETLEWKLEQLLVRIRKVLEEYHRKYQVSLSIGAAFVTPALSDYEKLYNCVDSALYEAKENGKNQYVIYQCKEERKDGTVA